jgi:hypothetical protein
MSTFEPKNPMIGQKGASTPGRKGRASRRASKARLARIRARLLRTLADKPRSLHGLCIASHHRCQEVRLALGHLTRHELVQETANRLYEITVKGRMTLQSTRRSQGSNFRQPAVLPVDPAIDPSLLNDVGDYIEDPEAWFHAPNIIFEGRAPIELLGTPEEARIRERIEAAKLGLFT